MVLGMRLLGATKVSELVPEMVSQSYRPVLNLFALTWEYLLPWHRLSVWIGNRF